MYTDKYRNFLVILGLTHCVCAPSTLLPMFFFFLLLQPSSLALFNTVFPYYSLNECWVVQRRQLSSSSSSSPLPAR
jgi:hypothetical protein